ncbi:MAG: hypothetical protein CW338_02685 [Clostridiales bacterium]|nr:hypothetical protein [Clostridiales bacterium]
MTERHVWFELHAKMTYKRDRYGSSGGTEMAKMKRITGWILAAVVLMVTVAALPVGAQAAGTTITHQGIVSALGDALGYGVVADTYVQSGHAETSVFVNHLERNTGDPFTTSGRAHGAAADYVVQADLTIYGAHSAIDDMEFAVFKKVGDSYVQVSNVATAHSGTVAASTNTAKAVTVTGIAFTITDSSAKRAGLYVFQVENGSPVMNGKVNSDKLVVQYGDDAVTPPEPLLATKAGNYIGDMHYAGSANQNNVRIMQGNDSMYSDGYSVDFGEGIYLYERIGNNYVKIDPATTTHSIKKADGKDIYFREDDWTYTGDRLYKKFENVDYIYENGEGRFTYYGNPIEFSFDNPAEAATPLLTSASSFSSTLANTNIGGTCTTSSGTAPSGGSNGSVSGPSADGTVVTVYKVDVVNGQVSLNSIGGNYGSSGLPISDNEYVILNVVVPYNDNEVSTCTLALRNEDNVKSVAGDWGAGQNDVAAFSRVIWNYVTPTSEGGTTYVPYKGHITSAQTGPGGLILAPEAEVTLTAVGDASSFIVKKIENIGVEIHQTLFDTREKVKVKLNMWPTGGIRFRKTGVQHTEYVNNGYMGWQANQVTPVLAGAEFIIYTDADDPEGSTVATAKSNKNGEFTVSYTPYGSYFPVTANVTVDGGFVVVDGLPTFDPDPLKYTVDRNGNINWHTSDKITYYLKETKAPDGYALPEENDPLTSFTLDSGSIKDLTADPFQSTTESIPVDMWNRGNATYGRLENGYVYGKLSVKKYVRGNAPANEEFTVTVSFTADDMGAVTATPQYGYYGMITNVVYSWTAEYDVNDGTAKTVKFENTAGTKEFHATFTLKDDDQLNFHNLPTGTYTVTETLQSGQAYQIVYDKETGRITETGEPLATITNKYAYGTLKLNKKVIGSSGAQVEGTEEEFNVTVTIVPTLDSSMYITGGTGGPAGPGPGGPGQASGYRTSYTVTHKSGSSENKDVTFSWKNREGCFEAVIKLKNGDSLSFGALPLGTYSVKENLTEPQKGMYVVSYSKPDGKITETGSPSATVTNRTADFKGGIKLIKVVQGKNGNVRTGGVVFDIYDEYGQLMDFNLTASSDRNKTGEAYVSGLPLKTNTSGQPVDTVFYLVEQNDTGNALQGAQNYTLGSGSDQITIRALKVTIHPNNGHFDNGVLKDGNNEIYYEPAGNNGEVVNKQNFGSLKITKKLVGASTRDGDYFTYKIVLTPALAAAANADLDVTYYIYREGNEYWIDSQDNRLTAQFTARGGKLEFSVNLPVGKTVLFVDLPEGSFTVTETGGRVNGANADLRRFTVTSEATGAEGTATGERSVTGVIKKYADNHGPYIDTSSASYTNTSTQMGYMKVTKQDIDTKAGLEGVEFGVYADVDCTDLVTTLETGSDGSVTSEEIPCAKYYVKEISNPNEGYLANDTVYEVTVTRDNNAQNPAKVNGGTVYNQKGISVAVAKTWEDDSASAQDRPSSVTVKLYRKVTGGTAEYVCDIDIEPSGASWTASKSGLPKYDAAGKEYTYSLKELDDDETEIADGGTGVIGGKTYEVTYGADEDGVLTVTNTLQEEKGAIKVVKVDAGDTSIKLSGAVFTIYSDSNCNTKVADMTATGTDGVSVKEGLEPGTYYVKETTPPDLYALNTTVYTVTVTAGNTAVVNGTTVSDTHLSTKITLKVKKAVTGITGSTADFVFNLTGSTGAPLPASDAGKTVTVKPGNTGSFGEITFTEEGEYTYTITEEEGDTPGYTYDTAGKTVTVKVKQTGGALVATVSGGTGFDASQYTQTVTNTYAAGSTKLTLKVKKQITGISGSNVEFTFTLAGTGSAPMPAEDAGKTVTVRQNETGNFGEITFTQAGTYTYTITESTGSAAGYSYDTAGKTVVVTVTDVNGALQAVAAGGEGNTAFDADSATQTVTNTYAAGSTKLTLKVKKQITGISGSNVEFTFTLSGTGSAPMPAEDAGKTVTVRQNETGNFGEITFTQAGTYTYTITESTGSAAGYSYDTAGKTVTVTVTDVNGALQAVAAGGEGNTAFDAEKATQTVVNTYKAGAVEFILKVQKQITGDHNNDAVFTFTLAGKKGTEPMPSGGNTVTVTGEGTASYGKIIFTEEGVYTYTITEADSGKNGYTYDTTPREITVTVTDKNGKLAAVAAGGEDFRTATDTQNFVNTYETEDASIVLRVRKEITGDDNGNASFTFTLAGLNGTEPMPAGNAAVTVTGEGTAEFGKIIFTKKGVYSYTITETDGGDAGYSYDTASKVVIVTVKDEGGALKASASGYAGFDTATCTQTITNTYTLGNLSLIKADRELPGVKLQGAVYSVYGDSSCTDASWLFDMPATDDRGVSVAEGVAPGTYYVKEKTAPQNYDIDPTVFTVAVEEGKTAKVGDNGIVTDLSLKGSMSIRKNVQGTKASIAKYFKFRVTFTGDNLPDTFYYTGDRTGSIQNGGIVELKARQSVTFSNLPAGTLYTVEEIQDPHYIIKAQDETGVITEGTRASVKFINVYTEIPVTGDETPVMLYAVLALGGLALLAAAVLLRKKKRI